MKFNEKLIELRKKQGLSQEELGYKLDVTRQTVSKWELGQTTPEMDKLVEIGKIFNVSVDELINNSTLEDDANSNPIIEDRPIKENKPKNKKTLIVILIGVLVAIFVFFIIKIFAVFGIFNTVNKGIGNEAEGFFNSIFSLFEGKMNVTTFNGGLQIYKGSQRGTTLKALLDQVITINKTKDKKVIVKYNDLETQDAEEIKNAKMKLKDSDSFEISFDYDSEGYINKVTIEKVVSQFEISSFNNGFEIFAGSCTGMTVTNVLDKIITSNKTEERKITVKYNQTETQDETEIRNIKRKFGTFDNCEIIFEYDKDGFINKAIIEKL